MGLSDFWRSLEQQAVPHVRAEVEKRGWKLFSAQTHRFGAERQRAVWMENGDGPFTPQVAALSGGELLEKIDREERCIRRSPTGVEIAFAEPRPECVTEDEEAAP